MPRYGHMPRCCSQALTSSDKAGEAISPGDSDLLSKICRAKVLKPPAGRAGSSEGLGSLGRDLKPLPDVIYNILPILMQQIYSTPLAAKQQMKTC